MGELRTVFNAMKKTVKSFGKHSSQVAYNMRLIYSLMRALLSPGIAQKGRYISTKAIVPTGLLLIYGYIRAGGRVRVLAQGVAFIS